MYVRYISYICNQDILKDGIMALTFNTDVGSRILSNHLNKITKEIEANTYRLTTGKKINKPSDDPAGYIMLQKFNTQISSSETGLKNVQLAQSELSYREDTLTSINSSLHSALSALKGYSSTTDENAKAAILATANAAIQSANQLKSSAKFNDKELYPTTAKDITVDLGDSSSITIDKSALGASMTIGATKIEDADVADAITKLEADIKANTGSISALGTYNSMLSSTSDNLTNKISAYEKTVDIISSTDVAAETAKLTQNQILQQVTAALLSQQSSSAYLALSLISG